MKTKYITTPLYYVNGDPHIGHSYTNVVTDTLARFYRLDGNKVFFLTGTDEHGQKIKKEAENAGLEPGDYADKVAVKFKNLWKELNIQYDDFIRTTEARHIVTVKKALIKLYKQGDLYVGKYEGWYCTPCETFWQAKEINDGLCPDCHRKVDHIEEQNYFFRLSKYQKWLLDFLKSNPSFIQPSIRYNETISFLENNMLQDLCITRPKARLSWGIEVPFSKEHVVYVWFDALLNYISACSWGRNTFRFRSLWPADIHLLGKDILRQHAVYWPIMLRALGVAMPRMVFAHGWWLVKGEKMSKSKGNILDPYYLINKYGLDSYRYFLLREVPFGLDGSFSEDTFIFRFNSDLANDLGNLVNRTINMIQKYFNGTIPIKNKVSDPLLKDLEEQSKLLFEKVRLHMYKLEFSDALSEIWKVINKANKLIELQAPWSMFKNNETDKLGELMYALAESLRIVTVAIFPFMPNAASKIWDQLGIPYDLQKTRLNSIKKFFFLKKKIHVKQPQPIFPRIKV